MSTLYIRPYVVGLPKRPEYGPGTAPPKAMEKLQGRQQRANLSSTCVNYGVALGVTGQLK